MAFWDVAGDLLFPTRILDRALRGNDSNSMPNPYQYPAYDPNTMAIGPQTEARYKALQVDPRGLQAFRKEALRTGESPWATLTKNKYINEEQMQRERAKREALSNTAQSESDLAMRGGLSSGARERLQAGSQRNLLDISQQAGEAGAKNRLGVDIAEQQNRMSQLQMLPSMENQAFQLEFSKQKAIEDARNTDIQRQIDEQARRQQAYAAQQQAIATRQAGRKTGLFGLGTPIGL